MITKTASVLLFLILVLVVKISLSTNVFALEQPTAEQIAQYQSDGTLAERIKNAKALGNHLASRSFAKRSLYQLRKLSMQRQGYTSPEIDEKLAPPPAWEGMPTTGTVNILAVLIAFSDHSFGNSASFIDAKLFGSAASAARGNPYDSLRDFYIRASYNQLNIIGNTLGWYTTAYPRSSVSQTISGRENLIKEVLNHYDSLGHDFSQYDSDGDGVIDYFVVIWTGPDNGWANFWWAYMTTFQDSAYTVDGKKLDSYSWQWEVNNPSGLFTPLIVIHETGHALGLPDLYDYDESIGPDGGVGGLDMMDANWGDHNCFSKFVLDWITPTTINSGITQSVTLNASGTSQDAVLVMPGINAGEQFDEFYMVQNRYRIDNDINNPNNGLLIWHIDARLDEAGEDFLYNNSYTTHKLVRLMEADGLEEIEMNWPADAGDYYTVGDTFGPATFPDSNRYDGTSTGITVENISAAGTVMTADISISNTANGDGAVYTVISPCRIIDTRLPQGGAGPIPGGTHRDFRIAGRCGIPSGSAKAVTINITATNAAGPGNLRVFAWPEPVPEAAILNYGMIPGINAIRNAVIVPICDTNLHACSHDLSVWASRSTDIVVDVLGYFAAPSY